MAALQTLCVYLVILLVVTEEKEMDSVPSTSIVKNESDCALHLQNPTFSSLSTVCTGNEAELSIAKLQEQPLTSNCTLSSRVETISRRMKITDQHHIATENCPPWYIPVYDNGTITACKCGSSLGGIVACNSFHNHYESQLHLPCFCMTHKEHDLNTTVVGHCLYGCYDRDWLHYRISNHTDLERVCDKFNRTGQLCGRCQEGFAPPVYSFHISCVECEKHTNNWLKYAAIAFGPLTLFLFIVIVFRISVTSAPLNAFVFITQVATSPSVMRVVVGFQERGAISTAQSLPLKFLSSLFGIWNLDFFRLVYKPFCLNPRATMIQVIAMDYIVAVYPLVLIGAAYTFVVLHDNRYQLIVWVWRPFHKCLSRFRRQWKIKSSLIGAFATFLLLSYSKFLAVSFDLLMPTPVYLDSGQTLGRSFLYYAGTVELFGREHRPYAILAVLLFVIVTIIPLLLLCLYPCHCFQRCLSCSGLRSATLHAFMDVFQMDYKDGSGNIRDCRYFSAVYLIVRIIFTGVYAATLNCYYFVVASFILILVALSIILIQPYKNDNHNRLDTFLILVLAVFHLSSAGLNVFPSVIRAYTSLSIVFLAVSVLTIFLYQVILLFHWILARQRLPQRILEQVQYLLNCLHLRPRNQRYEEIFPDHLHCTIDTNECTSLLPQPVPDDEEV